MADMEGGKDSLEGFDCRAAIAGLDDHLTQRGSLKDLLGKDPLIVYDRISETTDRKAIVIEQYIACIDNTGVRREPLERAVKYIPMGWESYQALTLMRLRGRNASNEDIDLVKNLTLEDVLFYASRQYREISTSLISMSLGSSEHRKALEKASFWAIMEERIGLAVGAIS